MCVNSKNESRFWAVYLSIIISLIEYKITGNKRNKRVNLKARYQVLFKGMRHRHIHVYTPYTLHIHHIHTMYVQRNYGFYMVEFNHYTECLLLRRIIEINLGKLRDKIIF